MSARSDAIDIGYALDAAVRDRKKMYDIAEGLARALADTTGDEDGECSFDHHGYCQEHGWLSEGECYIPRSRHALDRWTEESGQDWREW